MRRTRRFLTDSGGWPAGKRGWQEEMCSSGKRFHVPVLQKFKQICSHSHRRWPEATDAGGDAHEGEQADGDEVSRARVAAAHPARVTRLNWLAGASSMPCHSCLRGGGGTTRGVLTWGGWAADHLCLACLGDHFFITFFMVGTTFTSIFIHFLPSPRASNNQPTNLHLPLEGGSEGIPTTFLCQQFPSLFLVKILFLVNFAIVTWSQENIYFT